MKTDKSTNKAVESVNYERTRFKVSDIYIDFDESIREESKYDIRREEMQLLAESIATNGLIQPIVICKSAFNPGDKRAPYGYRVIAGRRRFMACAHILNWDTIPAIVREYKSKIDEILVQFDENESRENWTDYDYAVAISLVKKEKPGIKQDEIATIFNKNTDWVKKKSDHIKVIESLPESESAHLKEVTTSEINATGVIKDKETRIDLVKEVAESKKKGKGLTTKEIREKANTLKTLKADRAGNPVSSHGFLTEDTNSVDGKGSHEKQQRLFQLSSEDQLNEMQLKKRGMEVELEKYKNAIDSYKKMILMMKEKINELDLKISEIQKKDLTVKIAFVEGEDKINKQSRQWELIKADSLTRHKNSECYIAKSIPSVKSAIIEKEEFFKAAYKNQQLRSKVICVSIGSNKIEENDLVYIELEQAGLAGARYFIKCRVLKK